jgi:phasin
MNTKYTATKPIPNAGASQAIGDMADRGQTQAKEAFEKASSGAIEGADLLKTCCATAVKGAQEYNNKFMEFAHANSNSAFEFIQKLYEVKSPSAFIELSTEHSRKQFEALTEQSKELAALAQKAAAATAAPVKTGTKKALHRTS